ncbi:fatty acid desaturase family protein [Kineococcus indalonis]|uniref:fatty acid desaturase family protein n=1 Tax=Kineococcus indalonis TaxID=2696566 RepID=UPI002B1BDFCE|nr:acyl-CoA desaturase [Kineococcus indalonis]
MTTTTSSAAQSGAPAGATAPRRSSTPYGKLTALVQEAGLMRRRRGTYWTRIAATTVAFSAVAAGTVLLRDSWLVLLLAAALAVVITQFAFLGHDAAHRQIFASHRHNETASHVFAAFVAGLSYGWWMGKHTRHHQAPNQRGVDGDIESGVVSFHEEAAAGRRGFLRWFTRHQGLFFVPLLAFEGFVLHIESTRSLLTGKRTKRRSVDASLIVAHWAVYASSAVLLMGPWKALAFFGVHMAAFGFCMGGAFAPNHVGMPIVPREKKVDYIRRQVLTSRNVSGGWFVDLVMGGLNFQVEHHLFPSMPRPNLRKAQPFVRQFCAEHGITYTETTFFGAYRAIISYLNEVGLAARNSFSCPLVSQLRS